MIRRLMALLLSVVSVFVAGCAVQGEGLRASR
jgi:hypothetical protein